MNYAFNFQDNAYGPDGRLDIAASATDTHNRAQEQIEIDWLKTAPDKVFLYVRLPKYVTANEHCGPSVVTELDRPTITTWLGTIVSSNVHVGPRAYVGFGRWTYRRPITARIFGTLYHGWYMESSGDYCRLRKAKRQRSK